MEKSLLKSVFSRVKTGAFAVTYWDGQRDVYGKEPPLFELVFNKKISVKNLITNPTMEFGEAYVNYSCAYFRSHDDSLAKAQMQKVDYSLKKLNIQPGQRLLDIGSGWGWLIIHAAKKYGAYALGITLSEEQVKETTARIKKEGLEGKVSVRLLDYRDLAKEGESFERSYITNA